MISSQLLITLGLHAFSALAMMSAAVFVFLQNPKGKLNILYFLLGLTIFLFEAGFVLAPLMPTENLAYLLWRMNAVDVFITTTAVAFMFTAVGLEERFKWYIRWCLIIAVGIFISTLVYPHLFIPEVTSKLYFPWYLNAGPLYVAMFVFFFLMPIFPFIKMVQRSTASPEREKIDYFIFMFALGYGIGPLNFALVFDYPLDPIYGSALWLSVVPVAYGILNNQLFDIRIVLKRALLYSTIIGLTTGALMLLIFLNDLLVQSIPWIQFWTIPLFAGVGSFLVGYMFWRSSAESERLKYEFVTVATHKLRTPLTQINWGIKSLKDEVVSKDAEKVLARIEHANARLIELTNIIFESTQKNTSGYSYAQEKLDLLALTKETIPAFQTIVDQKNIRLNIHADEPVPAIGDIRRIRSVIEVLLENALAYSPENSLVQIITYVKGGRAYFSIKDEGIGVSSEEKHRIFMRFYRSDAAKRADTEGVGLGLAMAKNIIKAHKGRIGVESQGEGEGSTFWFWIPIG